MLTEIARTEVLARLEQMERLSVQDDLDQEHVSIATLAARAQDRVTQLASATDPVMPIVRTALVINWPEAAAKARADRFQRNFPHVRSLADLSRALDAYDPQSFCRVYLGISTMRADNPKYLLLKGLVLGLLNYQADKGFATEIEALRHWASNVDVKRLKDDPIGKARGVGPGVVGNIRLNLGIDAVKPDRHVIGVAQQVLGLKLPPAQYGDLAAWLGYGRKYFDEVLFRYGQAKRISA